MVILFLELLFGKSNFLINWREYYTLNMCFGAKFRLMPIDARNRCKN